MSRKPKLICLSIRQPHASLIVEGPKWCENRTWTDARRGRILICSGQKLDRDAYRDCHADIQSYCKSPLWRGHAVGMAELIDIVPRKDLAMYVADNWDDLVRWGVLPEDRNDVNRSMAYCAGPQCLILGNRRLLLRPFPLIGKLRLFEVELPASAVRTARGK